ncbi:MAG: GTP-binding protein [Oceanospirillaceae bacterium]|nr:GTP-binding protein [Oceanospirillaceae bacterium]
MIQKKVCIFGASAVGKTSLVNRYVAGIFNDKYLTSIGVKIDKKIVKLNDNNVQLMLWDIEGIDRYSGFNRKFIRGASVAIVVVDQSRIQSFQDGLEITRMLKQEQEIPVILVINKSDLPPADAWHSILENESPSLFEAQLQTSAKQNTGVDNLFFDVAKISLNHT